MKNQNNNNKNLHVTLQHFSKAQPVSGIFPLQLPMGSTHFHESLTFQFVQFGGSTVEAFSLRIQERVQHLPPCPAIQHKGQPHDRCNWYEDSIHCQMFGVNSEYSQKSNSSNNAAHNEKKDDKRWETASFFPFLFTCNWTNSIENYYNIMYPEDHNLYGQEVQFTVSWR